MVAHPDPTAIAGLEFGLAVQDMDRALAFYRDLLRGSSRLRGGTSERADDPAALRQLDSQADAVDPEPTAVNPPGRATGIRYVSFRVDNLLEIIAACENAGVSFRPTDSPVTSDIQCPAES